MILRLLYRIFPTHFHKLVFESQRKPRDFSHMELVFIDGAGKRNYQYRNEKDMPIVRKAYMEKCFLEMSMQLHASELGPIIEALELAMSRRDAKGNMHPDIAMIGHLIMEIKNRKEMLIHPDICMDLCAALFVREDENPGVIDDEIHTQKIRQYTIDSQGGLRDFFYGDVLSKYTPFSGGYSEELKIAIKNSRNRINALRIQLEAYSSERKSEPT